MRIHEEETRPLHSYLRYPQQRRRTRKRPYLLATRHIARAFRQDQDVGNTRCAGHSA
jgi:hypothetical protein